MRHTCLMALSLVSAGLLAAAALGAAGSLSLPYANTFETYTNGYPIANEAGWGVAYGMTGATVVVASQSWCSNSSSDLPQPTTNNHTKVLSVEGVVSTVFSANSPDFAYIDFSVLLVRRDCPPTKEVTPAPQVAVYVNTNGNLVFYYTYWDYGTGYTGHQTWSTNDTFKISSNELTRLTFELAFNNYTGGGYFGDSFYRVRINGRTDFYTNGLSYSLEDVSGGPEGTPEGVYPTTNRTWFMCADNTDDSQHNHKLDSFTVSGFAQMDDFVASTNSASYTNSPSASQAPAVPASSKLTAPVIIVR
jgi:hypothetical protein